MASTAISATLAKLGTVNRDDLLQSVLVLVNSYASGSDTGGTDTEKVLNRLSSIVGTELYRQIAGQLEQFVPKAGGPRTDDDNHVPYSQETLDRLASYQK